MLINFSNHPYKNWTAEQKDAAKVYGKTVDLPFPSVLAGVSEEEISRMAEEAVEDIIDRIGLDPNSAVMAQGEFTLTFAVVKRLISSGIKVISACSDRHVTETIDSRGKRVKRVKFCFERFREYR